MKKEEFEKLPVSEQKIIIAHDVIQQLRAQVYVPISGQYISSIELNDDTTAPDDYVPQQYMTMLADKDIQEFFPKIKNCHVCAIGACMLSITKFKNQLNFSDIDNDAEQFSEKANKLFVSVFTPREAALMEYVFEGKDILPYARLHLQECDGRDEINAQLLHENEIKLLETIHQNSCLDGRTAKEDNAARILSVMDNIIRNNGEIIVENLQLILDIHEYFDSYVPSQPNA